MIPILRILVCDDEPSVYEKIGQYVRHYYTNRERDYELAYCPTAQALLDAPFDYDILFLDIMLDNGNDGIQIGRKLRAEGNSALFVLTTSRKDRALDGYQATVFRYLVKPVQRDEVKDVLDAAIRTLEYDKSIITVKFKYQTEYVHVKNILYVESYLRRRHIVTKEHEYPTTATWSALQEQFSAYVSTD